MRQLLFTSLVCLLFPILARVALGDPTVPYPTKGYQYGATIYFYGGDRVSESATQTLATDVYYACRSIHTATYAIENFWREIFEYFGTTGANFSVLYQNYEFYHERFLSRYHTCYGGSIKLNLVGDCPTERGTLAYVKTTFGIVHSTINICGQYFSCSESERRHTLVHEFGRLEGIGDSEEFDTDNIYVWDGVVGRLNESLSTLEQMQQSQRSFMSSF